MLPNQDDKSDPLINEQQAINPPELVAQPSLPVSDFVSKTEPTASHIISNQPTINPNSTPTEEHVFKPKVFGPAMPVTNMQSDKLPDSQLPTPQPTPPAINRLHQPSLQGNLYRVIMK